MVTGPHPLRVEVTSGGAWAPSDVTSTTSCQPRKDVT